MSDPNPDILAARAAYATADATLAAARRLRQLADHAYSVARSAHASAASALYRSDDPLWAAMRSAEREYSIAHAIVGSDLRRRDAEARLKAASAAFDAALPPVAAPTSPAELLALLATVTT